MLHHLRLVQAEQLAIRAEPGKDTCQPVDNRKVRTDVGQNSLQLLRGRGFLDHAAGARAVGIGRATRRLPPPTTSIGWE